MAFLLPVLFNSGSDVLWHSAYFDLTREGLRTGGRFAARILFLLLVGSLIVRTTSPEALTEGVGKLLGPLRYIGLSGRRLATILSVSWAAFPFFWQTARNAIRDADLKQAAGLRSLVPMLSELIARLYLKTGPESRYWEALGTRLGIQEHEEPENIQPDRAASSGPR